jgi:uncharacterized protein (DUF433 family)
MVGVGHSIESVANGYDLDLDDVIAALDYERSQRAVAA